MDGFFGTAFPQMAVLGNTWDEDIVYEVADAQGKEAKYGGVGVLLRPGVNMKRSPLCGRNFEYYAEDPVLAGELSGAYIRGLQKNKVAACMKHFAVNNQEFERMCSNAVVSERALREIYLRVFEIAIKKGNPWTIMTSYNKVNGEYAHANKELLGILRKEFGYDGVVMSDCMAVHYEKVKAHQSGLDVELDETEIHNYQLRNALESGEFSEAELDEIVRRVVEVYDKISGGQATLKDADLETHHEIAVRAACEGMVLLKNDGILPFDPDEEGTIALIGRYAKEPSYMGGGSGHMNGRKVDAAYDAVKKIVKGKSRILYADGYEIQEGMDPANDVKETLVREAVEVARQADKVVVFTGYDFGVESEGYDRADLLLPKSHRVLLDEIRKVNQNLVLVINTGSAVQLTEYAGEARAILYGGYSGEGIGTAEANVLFGLAEPGGRLAETFPLRIEDTPAFLNFPNYPNPMHDVVYGEDIYIGYRWYDTRKMEVLYPFGHGLSYTSFAYSDFEISKELCGTEDELEVFVTVKNTGSRKGSDVVQLYIGARTPQLGRPQKELKAFKKVHLEPGCKERVRFTLSRHEFETYAPGVKKWVVEPGAYEIMIGRSSRDIQTSGMITMVSKERPYSYDGKGAAVWIEKSKNFKDAVKEVLDQDAMKFFEEGKLAGLASSMPWERFAEVDLGQGKTSVRQLYDVIEKLEELDLKEE